MKKYYPFLLVVTALLWHAQSAQAHSVWIEKMHGGFILHFGDIGELETSPGHLDELAVTDAWTTAPDGKAIPIKIKKKSEGYALTGVSAATIVVAESDFDVLSATNKPSRKPLFHARWQSPVAGAGKPLMTFDLVPTGKPGEIQVFFHGQPLADATVTLTTPDEKTTDQVSDKDGLVHFTTDKPGLYLATSAHQRDNTVGYSRGERYDLISHNCSLCWQQ